MSGLDPLVEHAIPRCPEHDPTRRPASASALASALPGGDPLAMAIAAGDTPSPEMVAAAGADVGITANMASVLLGVALVGMVVMALLAGRVAIYRIGAPVKASAVMVERARELLAASGARGPVADSAWGLSWNEAYLNSPRSNEAEDPDAMARFGVNFWYRERPVQLERWLFVMPYYLTAVWHFDPPMNYSGESMVKLDREGRLFDLTVIAPERPGDASEGGDVNWSVLFKAAGLDEATWAPADPQWVPLNYADRRFAWRPGRRNRSRLFASKPRASGISRPAFHLSTHGRRPIATRARGAQRKKRIGDLLGVSLVSALMLGSAFMARRDLRLDRADRNGALHVGVVAGLVWVAWILDEHHVASILELYLVVSGIGLALFTGAFASTVYLALEPQVRRTWPSMLVSWSRFLAGDVFNPLVARDVLIGAAVVTVVYSLDLSGMLLARRLTGLLPFLDSSPRPFMGGLHIASEVTLTVMWAVVEGLMFLLLYYIVCCLVRVQWAAVVVCALIMSLTTGAVGGGGALVRLPFEFAFSVALIVVLARVGLVGLIVSLAVMFYVIQFPFTCPLTEWYSMVGVTGVAQSAALVVAAYRIVIRAQVRPVRA